MMEISYNLINKKIVFSIYNKFLNYCYFHPYNKDQVQNSFLKNFIIFLFIPIKFKLDFHSNSLVSKIESTTNISMISLQ